MSTLPIPKQALIDIVIFFLVCIPVLVVLAMGEPVVTGFWCRDQSLRYPYKEDSVPQTMLVLACFGGPFLVMLMTESIRAAAKTRRPKRFGIEMLSMLKAYGVFMFGLAANVMLTDCLKFSVGRHRPHFINLCKPDFSKINCTVDGMDVDSTNELMPKYFEPDKKTSYIQDDVTEIVLDTLDKCQNVAKYDALIVVHSANYHFQQRQDYRDTYGNPEYTRPYRLKVVFFLGLSIDPLTSRRMQRENSIYGDTVVTNHIDSYYNMTYKAVAVFKWMNENCRNPKAIIKMDDDVIFDVHRFFEELWPPPSHINNAIYCHYWLAAKVERVGKWRITLSEYIGKDFPPYCSGFFVVIPPAVVNLIYQTARSVQFIWIDDVFIYGLVREKATDIQLINPDHMTNKFVTQYECTNTEVDHKLLRDSRLSFPSGHASLSVYSAIFTIFYLQLRMHVSFSHLLRPTIQLGMLILAVLCCVTRINDHKHFASDVIAGAFIGTAVAGLAFYKLGRKVIPNAEAESNNNNTSPRSRLPRSMSMDSEPHTPTPLLRPERLNLSHSNHNFRNGTGGNMFKSDIVNNV